MHIPFFGLSLGLIALTGSKLVQSIERLQESLLRVNRLEGLLPICANCKRIRLGGADRANQDSWLQIERYIEERTDAEFTHGLCPLCFEKLYSGLRKPKS